MSQLKVIYKITYPNGKIYIGQDITNSVGYFGSPNSKNIAKDFTDEELKKFTVTKEIIWSSETATNKEVNIEEYNLIKTHHSNHPKIGYNLLPKHPIDVEIEKNGYWLDCDFMSGAC